MSKPRTRNLPSPADVSSAGEFFPLIHGQFYNPRKHPPANVKRDGYLGVEKPTNRGDRYLESPDQGGVAKESKG